MERGLLWFPLLIAFFWLAWEGWKEFQKIETYRSWAEQFEQAKYDIYSVLGQKDNKITWGKPTTKGPIQLETFSLDNVEKLNILIDEKLVDIGSLPSKGKKIELEFEFNKTEKSVRIPFTEIPLAAEWGKFLQEKLQSEPSD
ncbi:hypothetical protein [Mastigocoleus testarum]|uniref:Uncharacterized protein n=1 Tax=Mastigocoleus testarum BC008 TaxID=371196 RepID=A0A0V7ZCZ8_9CYAN|nr:hypothetical protein [Mastigocoleus testarum]KST62331.1 hypothetical protein BC008_09210 [Mastigocoleus testarum BC008]KST70245.1 hypothetical protein BC008_36970 [Mastigocoleus testarum BC008]